MLWYKTPLKAVSLYAGVGLAGRGSLMSHSYHQSSYVYTDMSEVWTIAANQTFLVGASPGSSFPADSGLTWKPNGPGSWLRMLSRGNTNCTKAGRSRFNRVGLTRWALAGSRLPRPASASDCG